MSSATGTATGRRHRRLVDCVLVALAYLAAFVLTMGVAGPALGVRGHIVQSGAGHPLPHGSYALTTRVPTGELAAGDLAVVPDPEPQVDRITTAGVGPVHGATTERVFAHVPMLGYVVGAVSGRVGVALLTVLVVLLALVLLRPGSAWSVRGRHPRPRLPREVS